MTRQQMVELSPKVLIGALRGGTPTLLLFILWQHYQLQQELESLRGMVTQLVNCCAGR